MKNRVYKVLIAVLMAFAVLFSACRQVGPTIIVPPSGIPMSFSNVVEAITPSVVFVSATGTLSSSTGSGVIMHEDGYILTNRHVVEGATTVHVTLQNRKTYNATNFWMDDLADLAVIKIARTEPFTAASFADDANQAKVGDWAVALGHPLGLSPDEGGATVTAGIISNLDRSFSIDNTTYYDVIQTDAAINPGNSGGPLLNLEGKVIGINSAVSTEAQSIGYAINASTARPVYEGLSNSNHTVARPSMGVGFRDVMPADVTDLGLPSGSSMATIIWVTVIGMVLACGIGFYVYMLRKRRALAFAGKAVSTESVQQTKQRLLLEIVQSMEQYEAGYITLDEYHDIRIWKKEQIARLMHE